MIGTHLFFAVVGVLTYTLLKEFGEKHISIYDKFEERKERVTNIYKPEGGKLYVVTTDKGTYTVDVSNGNVFISDKKEEVKNNTELNNNIEPKIKEDVIAILAGDTPKTKSENKKKRKKIYKKPKHSR